MKLAQHFLFASALDSSGHVLLGYSTDQGGGQELQVNGAALVNGNLTLGANATLGVSSGTLFLTASQTWLSTTSPALMLNDTSRGTDLKNWAWASYASNISLNAVNDSNTALTSAYTVTRGTGYNVAGHTFSISTTAGSPIASFAIDEPVSGIATGATNGFPVIQTMAGIPTASPQGGAGSMVMDTTDNRLYIYNGTAWKYATLN